MDILTQWKTILISGMDSNVAHLLWCWYLFEHYQLQYLQNY